MKKTRDYSILCYIGLFFLIIFLLLPLGLRLFGKDLYNRDMKDNDEIVILSCTRQTENVSSTFQNGEPQNIEYRIKGDYSVSVSDEDKKVGDETVEEVVDDNALSDEKKVIPITDNYFLELIKPYSQITYNESIDTTSFKVKVSDLKGLSDYKLIFDTLDNQQRYFIEQSFTCQKASYE